MGVGGKALGTSTGTMPFFRRLQENKKAFDRVYYNDLWQALKRYRLDKWLTDVIRSLYDEVTRAVLLNGSAGGFLRTIVQVRR